MNEQISMVADGVVEVADKLPEELRALVTKPWAFSLFQAVSVLEEYWATTDELANSLSHKIRLTPCKEMTFLGSEVKACTLDPSGNVINLESGFLGLYGVDAPLPLYVLELAASDSPGGERVRHFLDMFNHLLYCQSYQIWKTSQLNTPGRGSRQYDQVLVALLEGGESQQRHCRFVSAKHLGCGGLQQLLRRELEDDTLALDVCAVDWLPLADSVRLGARANSQLTPVLGDNTILGARILVSGQEVGIKVGPLLSQKARTFYPQGAKGQQMASLLKRYLPPGLRWHCEISLLQETFCSERSEVGKLHLGQHSYLGGMSPRNQLRVYEDQLYVSNQV